MKRLFDDEYKRLEAIIEELTNGKMLSITTAGGGYDLAVKVAFRFMRDDFDFYWG